MIKQISLTVKNGLETSDYNIEFVNNDKPTILFTESVAQKPTDSQTQKSEFELELIGLVKFKGNTLKGNASNYVNYLSDYFEKVKTKKSNSKLLRILGRR